MSIRNNYCEEKGLLDCITTPVMWFIVGLVILYYWTCCPAQAQENRHWAGVPQSTYTDCATLEDGALYCTTVQIWETQGGSRHLEKCNPSNNWCGFEEFKEVHEHTKKSYNL
jgi:hypothetical protein